MTDHHALLPVELDRLPAASFRAAVTYLEDVLRECQLVLVSVSQGREVDPLLAALAEGLVPDIEEVGDAFKVADLTTNDDGTLRLVGTLELRQAATITHLHMQMVQLRLLGRRGSLLLESDPQLTQVLAWIWDEIGDQLHGRAPRPYRPAT